MTLPRAQRENRFGHGGANRRGCSRRQGSRAGVGRVLPARPRRRLVEFLLCHEFVGQSDSGVFIATLSPSAILRAILRLPSNIRARKRSTFWIRYVEKPRQIPWLPTEKTVKNSGRSRPGAATFRLQREGRSRPSDPRPCEHHTATPCLGSSRSSRPARRLGGRSSAEPVAAPTQHHSASVDARYSHPGASVHRPWSAD